MFQQGSFLSPHVIAVSDGSTTDDVTYFADVTVGKDLLSDFSVHSAPEETYRL